jgi:hypothetical protein
MKLSVYDTKSHLLCCGLSCGLLEFRSSWACGQHRTPHRDQTTEGHFFYEKQLAPGDRMRRVLLYKNMKNNTLSFGRLGCFSNQL